MFLSCGDSLFDLFHHPREDVAEVALQGRVGGSPLNVALGLARLGHVSAFFAKVSNDSFGQRIRAFMEREGIDPRYLVPSECNTTLAMVSLSPAGVADYRFHIEGTADRSLAPADVPEAFPEALKAIHFASYSTVLEPAASALAKLLRQETGRRFISYDPNVRASIEPNLDRWRERVAASLPHADLVKASEEDLALLYPGKAPEAVLSEWIAAGAALAVVTLGGRGALALAASGIEASVPGEAIRLVDTVGAGDTFQAALLSRLADDGLLSREALCAIEADALRALLAFAARAAALTCTRRGADLPTRADLA